MRGTTTTVDVLGEGEGEGTWGEWYESFRKQLGDHSHTGSWSPGSLGGKQPCFYRLSAPSCGSSMSIKMMSSICLKREGGKWGRKEPKIYSEASVGFRIYFGVSDMLVHQRGALLKSAGWVVSHLHGFTEPLKHLFRSDSSAQYKDVIQGCGFHAPALASRVERAKLRHVGLGMARRFHLWEWDWQHLVLWHTVWGLSREDPQKGSQSAEKLRKPTPGEMRAQKGRSAKRLTEDHASLSTAISWSSRRALLSPKGLVH